MTRYVACCDRAGVIRFRRRLLKGTLPIDRSQSLRALRRRIEPVARLAYDGKTLLVPGVPEAPTEEAALGAFHRFCDWLHSRPIKRRAA